MALSIHLGAHKTASTHLQFSLRQIRNRLSEAGLFYADPALLRDALPLGLALAQGTASNAARECRRQFEEARATHEGLLISEENILGGTHRTNMYSRWGTLYSTAPRRLRQVITMAGTEPATLYLSIRDPASFHVSAFALQLSAGNEIELEPYLGERDPARVRWSGLVKRLAAVEGVSRIVVWRYEDYAAIRPELLARLVPPALLAEVPAPAPRNVSVTQPGYDWYRERAMIDTQSDLRDLFQRARKKFPREAGHPPLSLLDDKVRARSAYIYGAEIAAIRRMPGVEFLDP